MLTFGANVYSIGDGNRVIPLSKVTTLVYPTTPKPVNPISCCQNPHLLIAFFSCTSSDDGVQYPQGGGLAQLGERLHGMQEVTSSSLVSSTIFLPAISDCLLLLAALPNAACLRL